MVKKIALGAVIAVLLLGSEALLAEKPEGKVPPCEVKANPAKGCPQAKADKPAPAAKPQRRPQLQVRPGRSGPHGPMRGFGFGAQRGQGMQGSRPQMGQILSRIAHMRGRFGQSRQGPGGPGRAFGGFGFGFGRAFGGSSRGRGPGRSMGFMRGRVGSRFGAAMRMRSHGAGRGRADLHGRGSRSHSMGRGPGRGGPGMRWSHRGGRGPQRGQRGPSKTEHGDRRGGRGRESRWRHGRS